MPSSPAKAPLGSPEAKPKPKKRKVLRSLPLRNLDSDQLAAKRVQIKKDLESMERVHKNQLIHVAEHQAFSLFKSLCEFRQKHEATSIGNESQAEFEELQDQLERHYNQMKYLANSHGEQVKNTRMGMPALR